MRTPLSSSVPKSQFKCYYCRIATSRRDGTWVNWNEMQVHLCQTCDRLTKQNVERAPSSPEHERCGG